MVRLSIVQFAPRVGEKDSNLRKIQDLVQRTTGDVVVLPELATTGYAYPDKKSLLPLADEFSEDNSTVKVFTELSREKKCMLVAGFAQRQGDDLFNSAGIFTPDGKKTVYNKLHLFSREKRIFKPGDSPPPLLVFKNAVFCPLICFDWFFTELFRLRTIDGAQVFLHCANLVLPWCQRSMIERAITNRVFIATANRIGREREGKDDYVFTGNSQIVSPKGDVLSSIGLEEGILEEEIDPDLALDKNVTEENNSLADRRMDIYEIRWKEKSHETTEDICAKAVIAKEMAYSPYSSIKVGAALEDTAGRVFTGCNVENASFGLTVCAERSAIFSMVASGGKIIQKLCVASDQGFVPCGACLQVIAEFSEDPEIITINKNGERKTWKFSELYPVKFSKENLQT
ncbi:cytidine deaminase [candidate division WOR-3 bacterium]|nr:cytidine deaminase [candidate division WOR-3 bacterium]